MRLRASLIPAMLVLLSFAAGCKESAVSRKLGKSRDMYPDQQSWESSITISREGLLIAKADSDEMIKYDRQNLAHLRGNVRIDFFNNQGDHVSRMFSDSADVNMLNNNLVAIGNVMIQSDSGLVLHTQVLNWSHEYDMIETDDSVMFATPDQDTLFGVGFESDVDLTHWKIYRPSGVAGPRIGNVN